MTQDILSSNDLIKEKIREIFFQIFPDLKKEDFSWNKKQKDFESWDSFAHLQLITMCEEIFEIEISLDDTVNITSPDELANCVKSLK